jgi:hypothetical protein
LSVPERLCLRVVKEAPYAWCTDACYHPWSRIVYVLEIASRLDAEAHEVCHAHQHERVLEAGLGLPGGGPDVPGGDISVWPRVPEGLAFRAAWPSTASGQPDDPQHIEDFAEVCRAWMVPETGGTKIGDLVEYPSLLAFLREWLPK